MTLRARSGVPEDPTTEEMVEAGDVEPEDEVGEFIDAQIADSEEVVPDGKGGGVHPALLPKAAVQS